MKHVKVSNNVIRRMPRYLRKLDELTEDGVTRISSSELGAQMGLTPSQIRQDFSCFGEFGQQGYGYNVVALRQEIATILGIDREMNAVLVGVGNLGRALAENFNFSAWGVNLMAAFDAKESLAGTTVNNVPIYNSNDIPAYLAEHKVDIVVLCVPKSAAKAVTESLISNGIEAFWNFTNVDVVGPDSPILVENMHFSDSMLALSYYIAERRDAKAQKEAKAAKK